MVSIKIPRNYWWLLVIRQWQQYVSAEMQEGACDECISGVSQSMMGFLLLRNRILFYGAWSDEHQFHLKKCKHLHVGTHDINFEYTIETEAGRVKVEKVTTEKDLRVTFDPSLKFIEHINNKVNKANRNVGLIFRTFTFMDKDIFLNLYNKKT